jgi:hypothetical protein
MDNLASRENKDLGEPKAIKVNPVLLDRREFKVLLEKTERTEKTETLELQENLVIREPLDQMEIMEVLEKMVTMALTETKVTKE